jgi:hypothetical protein
MTTERKGRVMVKEISVITEEQAAEIAVCPHCGVSLHASGGESSVCVTQVWVATLDERGVVIVDGCSMDTTCKCSTCFGIIEPTDMDWS